MTTYIFKPDSNPNRFNVSWTDPSVWVNGTVPNSADADVVFPAGSPLQHISTDRTLLVNSIDLPVEWLTVNSDLSVNHDTNVHDGGRIELSGVTLSTGSLELSGSNGINGNGSVNISGQFTNSSTVTGSNLTITTVDFINNGLLNASPGGTLTLHVTGTFQNFSGGTLTGGRYRAGNLSGGSQPAILSLDIGALITNDAADITLYPGAIIQSFDPLSNQYVPITSSLRSISSSGILSIYDSYTFGSLIDSGTINTGSAPDTYTFSQLTIGVAGRLIGGGTLVGPISNSGIIEAAADASNLIASANNTLVVQQTVSGPGIFEIAPGVPPRPGVGPTYTLELFGPQSENVVFLNHGGVLFLHDAAHFNGTISPSGYSGDQIEVEGFDLGATRTYSGDTSGGTLTLQENGVTAALHFSGSYNAQTFSYFAGTSSNPHELFITVNLTAPTLSPSSDSGVSNSDDITNVTTPTITGQAETDASVKLLVDGVNAGTTIANGGVYAFTSPHLGDGTHNFTVTVTDAANGDSSPSPPLSVSVDTAAPSVTVSTNEPSMGASSPPATITFTFSEQIGGFDASDISAVGGSISGLAQSSTNPRIYTATFTPDRSFTGTGSVTVAANSYTDIAGNSGSGGATSFSENFNSPPVARSDAVTLAGTQAALSGNVLANDSDPDGDPLRVISAYDFLNGAQQQIAVPSSGSVSLASNHGVFTISADGSFTFTANDSRPVSGHYADDPLVYSVSDGRGGTATAPLNVNLASQQRPSSETFNFFFVNSSVTYGNDGQVYVTGPDAVAHNVTGVGRLIFGDGQINEADGAALVDDLYYDSLYHDVYTAGVDPDTHYAANGWHEGRNPNPYFNTNYYLRNNPDVFAAGINPLQHYDSNGWHEGRNPGPNFNTVDYELANPDVAVAGVDPLAQYLSQGLLDNRVIFPADAGTAGPVNGFDPSYYLQNNPDVAAAHVNPLQHYLQYGWHEGRNPSADFNTNYYETHNPDVAAAGIDPLIHYDQYGWHEGRDPSAVFSTTGYLTTYPDIAAAGINPLQHYLQFGMAEGRSPTG